VECRAWGGMGPPSLHGYHGDQEGAAGRNPVARTVLISTAQAAGRMQGEMRRFSCVDGARDEGGPQRGTGEGREFRVTG